MQPGSDFWQFLRRNRPPGTDGLGPSEGQPGASSPVQRRFSNRPPPAASWRVGLSGVPLEAASPHPPVLLQHQVTFSTCDFGVSGCTARALFGRWVTCSDVPPPLLVHQGTAPGSPVPINLWGLLSHTKDWGSGHNQSLRVVSRKRPAAPTPPPALGEGGASGARSVALPLHLGSDVFMG